MNRTNHRRGADHPSWKGDDASYSAVHKWARRHLAKAPACEHCGQTEKPLEWANVSGDYRREPEDWLTLCRRCHRRYDRRPRCPHGHLRTPENTFIDHRGISKCRTCKNDAWRRRYYERQGRHVPVAQ